MKKVKKVFIPLPKVTEIQIFDDPIPAPRHISPVPMKLPKQMPRAFEMDAPNIPTAYRKMIYKEQNYFTECKAMQPMLKLLDHRNAKELLLTIFNYLYIEGVDCSGIDLF